MQKLVFIFFYCFLVFFIICENCLDSKRENFISNLLD